MERNLQGIEFSSSEYLRDSPNDERGQVWSKSDQEITKMSHIDSFVTVPIHTMEAEDEATPVGRKDIQPSFPRHVPGEADDDATLYEKSLQKMEGIAAMAVRPAPGLTRWEAFRYHVDVWWYGVRTSDIRYFLTGRQPIMYEPSTTSLTRIYNKMLDAAAEEPVDERVKDDEIDHQLQSGGPSASQSGTLRQGKRGISQMKSPGGDMHALSLGPGQTEVLHGLHGSSRMTHAVGSNIAGIADDAAALAEVICFFPLTFRDPVVEYYYGVRLQRQLSFRILLFHVISLFYFVMCLGLFPLYIWMTSPENLGQETFDITHDWISFWSCVASALGVSTIFCFLTCVPFVRRHIDLWHCFTVGLYMIAVLMYALSNLFSDHIT